VAHSLISCALHRNEYAFPEDEEDQDSEEDDDDDVSHSDRPADWDRDEVGYSAAGRSVPCVPHFHLTSLLIRMITYSAMVR
jgi:hypothetical protein